MYSNIMGNIMRKLTIKEKEVRIIRNVKKRIRSIEYTYGSRFTRLGCQQYANKEREKFKLSKEIKERELELTKLKAIRK